MSGRARSGAAGSLGLLNRKLGSSFVLAHASESLMALTDWADDASLARGFEGCGCAVLATRYAALKQGGEYGLEANMELEASTPGHTARLTRLVGAATDSGCKHCVVIETPGTPVNERSAALRLCRQTATAPGCEMGFTYVAASATSPAADPNWTFKAGVPSTEGGITVTISTDSDDADFPTLTECPRTVTQEDLAAVVVESIQTLPWGNFHRLIVNPSNPPQKPADGPSDEPSAVWVVGYKDIEDAFTRALS